MLQCPSDGIHYMKFHVFASEHPGGKGPSACLTGFVQPEAGSNLEFENILSGISLCLGNKNPSNYDLKQKYLQLKADLSHEHRKFVTF